MATRIGLATLLVMAIGAGCDRWSDGESYEYAVYSETGEGVAAVFQTYEKQNKFTYIAKRHHASQVVLRDADGEWRPLTPLQQGDVADLFYQHEQGYVVFGRMGERVSDSTGSQKAALWYERVYLDGSRTSLGHVTGTVMLSCDGGTSQVSTTAPLRVIPNHDGSMLAKVTATTTCSTRTQSLSFLDAHTLEVIDGPIDLGSGSANTHATNASFHWVTADMAWTADGAFAITYWDDFPAPDYLNASLYYPGGPHGSEAVMHFDCMSQPTASSYRRSDGQSIYVNENTGELTIFEPDPEVGFGCDVP